MEITSRIKEGVAVLGLNGRFVVSSGETEVIDLRCAIAALVAKGRVFVALHLAGLASIDARGLGELVMTHTTLRALGGELMLVGATAGVRRMLAVTRLDTVLPLCDSEAEAMRSIRRITSPVAGSEGGSENGHYVEPRGHTPLMPAIVSSGAGGRAGSTGCTRVKHEPPSLNHAASGGN